MTAFCLSFYHSTDSSKTPFQLDLSVPMEKRNHMRVSKQFGLFSKLFLFS